METRLADLRRHLHFLATHAFPAAAHHDTPWEEIAHAAEQLAHGTSKLLGSVLHLGSWKLSSSTSRLPGAFRAAQFLAENHYNIPNVVAVRIARGIRDIPSIRG